MAKTGKARSYQHRKSFILSRCRAWGRWWRHPDRDIYRRQLRRGARFWLGFPWLFVLPFLILLKWSVLFGPGLLHLNFGWYNTILLLLPSWLTFFAWATCLQDSLANFRGSRLAEILLTPSSPKRFFPALLVAPIVAWSIVLLIGNSVIAPYSTWLIYRNLIESSKPFEHVIDVCSLHVIWFLIGSAVSIYLLAGMTATAAALTIGYSKSIALIRSIFIAVVIYSGMMFLQTGLYPYFYMVARGFIDSHFVAYIFGPGVWFCSILIGLWCWRFGLSRLQGPKTLARLQAAMESPR